MSLDCLLSSSLFIGVSCWHFYFVQFPVLIKLSCVFSQYQCIKLSRMIYGIDLDLAFVSTVFSATCLPCSKCSGAHLCNVFAYEKYASEASAMCSYV